MKLEDIVSNDKVIDLQTLKADQQLVQDIQTQLSRLSLYPSSEIDGLYGQMTEAALNLFCEDLHLDNMDKGQFGKCFANQLLTVQDLPERRFLSEVDYERAAARLGVEVQAIRAVVAVEAAGSGFLPDGRPKILFERHLFWSFTPLPVSQTRPDLSNPRPGGYIGGAAEWNRLNDAIKFDRTAALRATSWGLGQVLGDNYQVAGYSDVEAFVRAMFESEGRQLDAMMNFIQGNHLDSALRQHDWARFAAGYNGIAGVGVYDIKLANAFTQLAVA
jgi:peptidoglycan hydrolase-like protein with peptidoglycan-binding domain